MATPSLLTIDAAKARALRGERPACDLGYCDCGTVWNMVTMPSQKRCPDCGKALRHIERGKQRAKACAR